MPPRYLNRRRRPAYRRKGPRKGYRIGMRKGRKSYKQIVSIKRVALKTWTTNSVVGPANDGSIRITGSNQVIQYTFQLSDLPNFDEITRLYDQYKIKGVQLKIVPVMTEMNTTVGGPLQWPIHSVLDFTDQEVIDPGTGAPYTLNDFMQYSTYKQTRGLRDHKRYIYPKQLSSALDGGVQVVADVQNKWIRSEAPGVDHLGIKVFIPANNSLATTLSYQVFASYYILAKQTK